MNIFKMCPNNRDNMEPDCISDNLLILTCEARAQDSLEATLAVREIFAHMLPLPYLP